MKNKLSFYTKIKNKDILKKIYKLNKYLLEQKEKVSYDYKNFETNDFICFNYDIEFYAASTIRLLPALYLYQKAEKK